MKVIQRVKRENRSGEEDIVKADRRLIYHMHGWRAVATAENEGFNSQGGTGKLADA